MIRVTKDGISFLTTESGIKKYLDLGFSVAESEMPKDKAPKKVLKKKPE